MRAVRVDILARKVRQEAQRRKQKERGEGNTIKDSEDYQETQDGGCEDARTLLHIVLAHVQGSELHSDAEKYTLSSTILCMSTKLQLTNRVSKLFEKVCVWKVHVTYEDAISGTATRRERGEGISSCIAQSSRTTLKVSISTRSVQYTTDGETSSDAKPSQSQRRRYMGQP
jgi:hypothetical protein